MMIYQSNPDTGEYVGSREARKNPLEPGRYLIPRGAVTEAPPETIENEAAVLVGEEWQIVPDFRGVTYWTVKGEKVTIEALGETKPEGALDAAPPSPTPTQAELDAADTLTPSRFRYMLAANGWVDVWADVEAWAKANDTAIFAVLYAQKGSEFYRLSVTLAFLNQVRPLVAQLHPDVDVSEATVRAAWAAAKDATLTLG